jgi:hypothetical protein
VQVDTVGRLFALAQALTNDFDSFEKLVTTIETS